MCLFKLIKGIRIYLTQKLEYKLKKIVQFDLFILKFN